MVRWWPGLERETFRGHFCGRLAVSHRTSVPAWCSYSLSTPLSFSGCFGELIFKETWRCGASTQSSLLYQYIKKHRARPAVTCPALHVFNCYIEGWRESKRGEERLLLLDWWIQEFSGWGHVSWTHENCMFPGRDVLTFLCPAVQKRMFCFALFCFVLFLMKSCFLFLMWLLLNSILSCRHRLNLWNKHVWVHSGLGEH